MTTRSSFPDDPDAVGRRPDWNDLPMFSAPLDTPSGPPSQPRTKAMNSFRAYQVWKRSEEGGKAFGWMLMEARRQLDAGALRISTKALMEACRAALKIELNNSHTARVSDDMVAADERLLDVIERRKRRKARA